MFDSKKKVSDGGRKMRRKMANVWEVVTWVQPSSWSESIYRLPGARQVPGVE